MRSIARYPYRLARFSLAGGLLLALAGCGAPPATRTVQDSDCDLNAGACSVDLGSGRRLTLAITPRPLPLMTPLAIRVRVEGAATPPVTLDFVGDSMDMGLNRRTLEPTASGELAGIGALPVCVTGTMRWRAEVTLNWPDGPQAVRFRFHTG